MTIWNALAAGGALWCALAAASCMRHKCDDVGEALIAVALALIGSIGFGLCLFGAIP